MSCEGPVLSVLQHPPPANPHFSAMARDPRKRFMFSSARERSSSTNERLLEVPEDSLPAVRLAPPTPTASLPHHLPHHLSPRTLTLPSAYSRSASLPRGVRGGSADPEALSQSSPTRALKASLSPRFFRRTATIDTNMISKEEYEDFTQLNQYKVVGIIGSGSYGIVHKATTNENQVYAMKIVGKSRLRRKSFPMRPRPRLTQGAKSHTVGARVSSVEVKSPLDNVHREIAILKKLDHPNVVKLVEVLDDPQEDELILVFEYIQKGSVMKEIPTTDTLSEDQAREYFIDLILGLEYLHSQHIIHRDIKPDNLLLDDDDHIKIADFGVSEEIDTSDTHLSKSAGTPAFTAPECLDVSTKTYKGQAVDIWAAGITLYCFIYGRVPFSAKVITELHDNIRTNDVHFPASPEISPQLKDLLLKLLVKDPAKRITIPEIRAHPWFCNTTRYIPGKEENCQEEIFVNQEEIETAFKPFQTPIHILVMIKQMAKKRSFGNPYSPRNSPRTSPRTSPASSPSHSPTPPLSPASPVTKRRTNLLKSHQTPTICVDTPQEGSSEQ